MNIRTITSNGKQISIVNSNEICIFDVQSALDFMMSVNYETGSRLKISYTKATTEEISSLFLPKKTLLRN